jgi:hypothetical protein
MYSESKMFSAIDTAVASENVSATAKTLGVPCSTLRGWTTDPELSECKKAGCVEKARPGPKPILDSTQEDSFLAEILQRHATSQATNIHTLLAHAKQKWRVLGTRGWLKRVLERAKEQLGVNLTNQATQLRKTYNEGESEEVQTQRYFKKLAFVKEVAILQGREYYPQHIITNDEHRASLSKHVGKGLGPSGMPTRPKADGM